MRKLIQQLQVFNGAPPKSAVRPAGDVQKHSVEWQIITPETRHTAEDPLRSV